MNTLQLKALDAHVLSSSFGTGIFRLCFSSEYDEVVSVCDLTFMHFLSFGKQHKERN